MLACTSAELPTTQRPYIVVDVDREKIERFHGGEDGPAFVVGDATDNETLEKPGSNAPTACSQRPGTTTRTW